MIPRQSNSARCHCSIPDFISWIGYLHLLDFARIPLTPSMIFAMIPSAVNIILSIAALRQAAANPHVPGPAFTPLRLPTTAIADIRTQLDAIIRNAVSSHGQDDTLNIARSSFAIEVTTATESIWTTYHTGETAIGSSTAVSSDTIFRIASISKTFTFYSLLLTEGVSLNDPVTKFLPELLDREDK